MSGLRLCFVVLLFLLCCRSSPASKSAPNRAYVQSGPDGVFYAKCIPYAKTGTKGITKIFRVNRDGDKLTDSYKWYSRGRVILGWSPLTGKIGVMSKRDRLKISRVPIHQNKENMQVKYIFLFLGLCIAASTPFFLQGWLLFVPTGLVVGIFAWFEVILPRKRMSRRAAQLESQMPNCECTTVPVIFTSIWPKRKRAQMSTVEAEMARNGWVFLKATAMELARTSVTLWGGLDLHFVRDTTESGDANCPLGLSLGGQ